MTLEDLTFDKYYLAPYNDLTHHLAVYLKANEKTVTGFIDSHKIAPEIINLEMCDDRVPILIFSPNYYKQLIDKFSSQKNILLVYLSDGTFNFLDVRSKMSLFIYPFLLKKQKFVKRVHQRYMNFVFDVANRFNIGLDKNTRTLLEMRGMQKSRIFIIGNGPSLRISDLEKLQNEVTIACNKIFLAFEETIWRPTYYTIEDPLDLFEYYDQIAEMDLGIKFFTERALWRRKKMPNAIYYKQGYAKSFDKVKISNDPFLGFSGGESVVLSMLQFALFLGSSEIYLIGFDHFYQEPKNYENAMVKFCEDEVNHFHKGYRKQGDIWAEPRLDNITLQFDIFKKYCEEHGIKVFNATRGGHLNIYERVDFDSLFLQ